MLSDFFAVSPRAYPRGPDEIILTPNFGPVHLAWVVVVLAVWVAVPWLLKHRERARNVTLYALAGVLAANEVIRAMLFYRAGVDYRAWLPVEFCSFMIYLTILAVFVRKPLLLNVCYALGTTVAIFGVFTPVEYDHPSFSFIYFNGMFSHTTLVLIPLIFIVSGEFRPDIRKLPVIVGIMAGFSLLVMAPLNHFLDANWFFLCEAPADTPFALFEGWVGSPGYLGLTLVLGVMLWTLFYLPFVIGDLRKRKRRDAERDR